MKIYNQFILCSFSEVFRALLTSYTKRQFCWPRSIVTPPDQACVTTIASMKTLKECKMVIMCFLFMNILSLPVSSASRQGKVNPGFFFSWPSKRLRWVYIASFDLKIRADPPFRPSPSRSERISVKIKAFLFFFGAVQKRRRILKTIAFICCGKYSYICPWTLSAPKIPDKISWQISEHSFVPNVGYLCTNIKRSLLKEDGNVLLQWEGYLVWYACASRQDT